MAWWDARNAAGKAAVLNLAPFYDANVVTDVRTDTDGRQVLRGREALIRYLSEVVAKGFTGGIADPEEPMLFLVSAEGFLAQFVIPQWPIDLVVQAKVDSHGTEESVVSGSVDFWRHEDDFEYWKPDPLVPGLSDLEAVADRYLALWNGTDAVAAGDVYASTAVVGDTLTGASAQGAAKIGSAVGTASWLDLPLMQVMTLPVTPEGAMIQEPRGRALYVGPSWDPSIPDEVTMVLNVDDGTGCPGVVGVALLVENDRVVQERRYHDVLSVRRCLDQSDLQSGWWDGIEIPDPVRHDLTGTVLEWPSGPSVAVYNGSSKSNAFVRWGLRRFEALGLTPPTITSVTFLADKGRCAGLIGFVQTSIEGADVTLCFQPKEACADEDCTTWSLKEELALLHELSHAWLDQDVSEEKQKDFMDFEEVQRWQDFSDDWTQRGVERAASSMSDALVDAPLDMPADDCAKLAKEFQILTGVAKIVSCGR